MFCPNPSPFSIFLFVISSHGDPDPTLPVIKLVNPGSHFTLSGPCHVSLGPNCTNGRSLSRFLYQKGIFFMKQPGVVVLQPPPTPNVSLTTKLYLQPPTRAAFLSVCLNISSVPNLLDGVWHCKGELTCRRTQHNEPGERSMS